MALTRLKQVGIMLVALLAAVGMIRLGWWQLDVYRQQAAGVAIERAEEAPRPLAEVAPPGTLPEDGYGRTVTFSGEFDAADQFLIPVPERPGHYRVLTALVQADGSRVPVVRGEAVLDATAPVAPPPPAGPQQLAGILLASEAAVTQDPAGQDASGEDSPADGRLGSVRLAEVAQQWPPPLVNGFVSLDAAGAAAGGLQPAQVSLPRGEGQLRNGGYAIQWVVFAAFGLAMAGFIARDIGRRDLAARTEQDEPTEHDEPTKQETRAGTATDPG